MREFSMTIRTVNDRIEEGRSEEWEEEDKSPPRVIENACEMQYKWIDIEWAHFWD